MGSRDKFSSSTISLRAKLFRSTSKFLCCSYMDCLHPGERTGRLSKGRTSVSKLSRRIFQGSCILNCSLNLSDGSQCAKTKSSGEGSLHDRSEKPWRKSPRSADGHSYSCKRRFSVSRWPRFAWWITTIFGFQKPLPFDCFSYGHDLYPR